MFSFISCVGFTDTCVCVLRQVLVLTPSSTVRRLAILCEVYKGNTKCNCSMESYNRKDKQGFIQDFFSGGGGNFFYSYLG